MSANARNRRKLMSRLRDMKGQRTNAFDRPFARQASCFACGVSFASAKPAGTGKKGWRAVLVIVEEIATSMFRGDDEVRFFHPECWRKHIESRDGGVYFGGASQRKE